MPFPFALFGQLLFEAFLRTNKIGYLNESISTRRQGLERPSIQLRRSTTLCHGGLSGSLLIRSLFFSCHRAQDLDEALELLSQSVKDGRVSFPDRFQLACAWTSLARCTQHTSISTAYESAVSLMQDTLLFAPTLQLQHATLATSNHTYRMPPDYASYQVDLHRLEEAIVTLERGRALLWSEMRHLRASIDQPLPVWPKVRKLVDLVGTRDVTQGEDKSGGSRCLEWWYGANYMSHASQHTATSPRAATEGACRYSTTPQHYTHTLPFPGMCRSGSDLISYTSRTTTTLIYEFGCWHVILHCPLLVMITPCHNEYPTFAAEFRRLTEMSGDR